MLWDTEQSIYLKLLSEDSLRLEISSISFLSLEAFSRDYNRKAINWRAYGTITVLHIYQLDLLRVLLRLKMTLLMEWDLIG